MKLRFDPDAELIQVTGVLKSDTEFAVLRLALDTGANFSVLTPQVFENIGQNVPLALEIFTMATANGFVQTPLIEVDALSALGVSRPNFQVVVHALPDSLDLDGVLGLDFLRNRRLTLDFLRGEIELV